MWLVSEQRTYALSSGENIVGRDPHCEVWLDDDSVSRRHASVRISAGDGVAMLADLQSTNGTFVGRRRVTTENPLRLMKVAWHLGNRHVPAEVTKDAIYIAPDHVLVEMVRGLGARAEAVTRPFRPERGAYHEHGGHEHGHHGHEHHEHGHACGCGHEH